MAGGFGWLSGVADKFDERQRSLRPIKDLAHNRELTAEALAEARRRAKARLEAEPPPPESPQFVNPAQFALSQLPGDALPSVDEMRSKGEVKQGNGQVWDNYQQEHEDRRGKMLQVGTQEALDEFNSWRFAEEERLKKTVGSPAPGTKAWAIATKEDLGDGGKPGTGFSLSSGESFSKSSGGAAAPIRNMADQYLAEQFSAEGPDGRMERYYADELEALRNETNPKLWGTSGADAIDKELESARSITSGKDAAKVEVARINAASKVSVSERQAISGELKAQLSSETNQLKRELAQQANALKGRQIDMMMVQEIGRMARSKRESALKNLTSLRAYSGTTGGFYRDAATGQLLSTQQGIAEAESQVASIENLMQNLERGMFRTGDELATAIDTGLGGTSLDPQYTRTYVPTEPTMLQGMGLGTAPPPRNPGSSPSYDRVEPRQMTSPIRGGGFSLSSFESLPAGVSVGPDGQAAVQPAALEFAPTPPPPAPPKPPRTARAGSDLPPDEEKRALSIIDKPMTDWLQKNGERTVKGVTFYWDKTTKKVRAKRAAAK